MRTQVEGERKRTITRKERRREISSTKTGLKLT